MEDLIIQFNADLERSELQSQIEYFHENKSQYHRGYADALTYVIEYINMIENKAK